MCEKCWVVYYKRYKAFKYWVSQKENIDPKKGKHRSIEDKRSSRWRQTDFHRRQAILLNQFKIVFKNWRDMEKKIALTIFTVIDWIMDYDLINRLFMDI